MRCCLFWHSLGWLFQVSSRSPLAQRSFSPPWPSSRTTRPTATPPRGPSPADADNAEDAWLSWTDKSIDLQLAGGDVSQRFGREKLNVENRFGEKAPRDGCGTTYASNAHTHSLTHTHTLTIWELVHIKMQPLTGPQALIHFNDGEQLLVESSNPAVCERFTSFHMPPAA